MKIEDMKTPWGKTRSLFIASFFMWSFVTRCGCKRSYA